MRKRFRKNKRDEYEELDRKINKINLLIICTGIIAVMVIGFTYSHKLNNPDLPTMSLSTNVTIPTQD